MNRVLAVADEGFLRAKYLLTYNEEIAIIRKHVLQVILVMGGDMMPSSCFHGPLRFSECSMVKCDIGTVWLIKVAVLFGYLHVITTWFVPMLLADMSTAWPRIGAMQHNK